MRLAVFADIHGNRRALDAVLNDLSGRGVDRIVNLGDSIYGPFDPLPVANRLIAADWLTVSGNEDRCLVEADEGAPVSKTAHFTVSCLERRHIVWLHKLPKTLSIDGSVFAFHASPADDARYLLHEPDKRGSMRPRDPGEVAADIAGIDAPLILCAHDHLPRILRLSDGRMVVNPGSVGCPAYADEHPVPHRVVNSSPHARYALVNVIRGAPVEVDGREVAYNWEAAANEAEANGFVGWGGWLRTGRAT